MNIVKKLNDLKKREKLIKIERNIYLVSTLLFFCTVIINIINIINYPYILNGLILEINILMILGCGYLFIQKHRKIIALEDEKIELKIACILSNR